MLPRITMLMFIAALGLIAVSNAAAGATTANGTHEGDAIHYVLGGLERRVSEQAVNQIYLVGGDRAHQANVVLHIPGESRRS